MNDDHNYEYPSQDYDTTDGSHYTYYDDGSQPPSGKRMSFGGILFLCVFLAGIVGAILFSRTEQMYAVACAGLCFASAGIFVLAANKKNQLPLSLLFVFVGLGMIIIPLLLRYQEAHPERKPIISEDLPIILVMILFVIIGAFLIFSTIWNRVRQKRLCTEPVQVTCIDLKTRRSSKGNTLYAPVWEYYYSGRTYTKVSSSASNVGYPNIGETREYFIDPNDPENLYNPSILSFVGMLLFGVFFGGFPLVMLIITLKQ